MYLYKSMFKTIKRVYIISKRNVHFVEKCDNKLASIRDRNFKKFKDIPGPKPYPVVGTLYKYLPIIGDYHAESLHKNAWLNYRRYGPLVRESLMPDVQILHVFDPADIEAVFRQEGKLPARRSHLALKHYRLSKTDVYNTGGLLSSNGEEWWKLRSSFQKNFSSPKCVKEHMETTDNIVNEFIKCIKDRKLGPSNDLLPLLNRLNLEVIGAIAFNERFNSLSIDELHNTSCSSKIIEAAFSSNSGIFKLDKGFLWKLFDTPLYKKLISSQDYLQRISKDILNKIQNTKDDSRNKSLLSLFLQQPNIDEKDVIGMMVDILMASIDTTAYSTSFMLYHLSRNPVSQNILFKEISELLPTENTAITADILHRAVYTRSCIKESLRLNPVSIGVGRILQKDIILKGYLIPEETIIVTQNMVASRLPQYVRNPLNFKPERWLRNSEFFENIHPFLSLPFGFGPRSCIARRLAEQSMTILLIRLIREFSLTWSGEELDIKTHLINKPNQPVQFLFERR